MTASATRASHGPLSMEIVDVEEACAVGQLFAEAVSLPLEWRIVVRRW